MKKCEITVEILENKNNAINTLISNGYSLIEKFIMDDAYFCSFNDIKNLNYKEIIKNSFILRTFSNNRNSFLIYKDKTFDLHGNVICEQKISCEIKKPEDAKKILKLANFNNFINIKTEICVFKNDKIQFVLQEIDGLGLFLEFEEFDQINHLSNNEKIDYLKEEIKKIPLKHGNDYHIKKLELLLNKKDL